LRPRELALGTTRAHARAHTRTSTHEHTHARACFIYPCRLLINKNEAHGVVGVIFIFGHDMT
jgi:hypothetical protein